jgi:hypothetical protein
LDELEFLADWFIIRFELAIEGLENLDLGVSMSFFYSCLMDP